MRCKKHPADGSCGVGICASCLRERLVSVIAAQAQAEVIKQALHKSESHLSFPRSVSPYISCRHHLFYSTPQVGPNASIKEKKKSRFSSLFWGLFRSKSNKKDLDRNPSCSASPAWFPNTGRRKQKVSVEESVIRTGRHRGWGLSPDDGESSGHSSDSHGWRHTPRKTRGRTAAHSSSLSGLTFCLSPLVRPSPNSHWNQKVAPPDVVATPKPHLSTAASFCKNRSRSRKLVDFGRCPSD